MSKTEYVDIKQPNLLLPQWQDTTTLKECHSIGCWVVQVSDLNQITQVLQVRIVVTAHISNK